MISLSGALLVLGLSFAMVRDKNLDFTEVNIAPLPPTLRKSGLTVSLILWEAVFLGGQENPQASLSGLC